MAANATVDHSMILDTIDYEARTFIFKNTNRNQEHIMYDLADNRVATEFYFIHLTLR